MATPSLNIVSAVKARKNFGELLDKAFYNKESFVVERSGEPRAAIVPLREYKEMKRRKQEAKNRLFEMIDMVRSRTAKYDPNDIQKAINEAAEFARKEVAQKRIT